MQQGKKRAIALLGVSVALLMSVPTAAHAAPGNGQGNGPVSNAPNAQAGKTFETSKTYANLMTAMHGEAFAYSAYSNFSELAKLGQNANLMVPLANSSPSLDTAWMILNGGVAQQQLLLPDLFTHTATVERFEHFAEEADAAGVVGTTAQNLQTAITGENYETTTMYPGFAADAAKAGDTVAAALFTDIGADEAIHRDSYKAALACLNANPTDAAAVNACAAAIPYQVLDAPVTLDATGAKVSKSRTFDNLSSAMHGEAFAYASYQLFAAKATAEGYPAIAAIFDATSQIERFEHFREEGNIAGTWGSDAANLKTAIAGETYETTTMYSVFSNKARAEGYPALSADFAEYGMDEAGHAQNYKVALGLVK